MTKRTASAWRCSTLRQFQILRRVFSPTGPPAEISRVSGGRSTPRAPTTSSSSCDDDDDDDDDFSISPFPSDPNHEMYPKCRSTLESPLRRRKVFMSQTSLLRRRRYDDSLALCSHSRIAIGRIEKKASRYAALCSTNPARVLWAPSIVHAHCLLVVASAVQGVPLNASTSSLR